MSDYKTTQGDAALATGHDRFKSDIIIVLMACCS